MTRALIAPAALIHKLAPVFLAAAMACMLLTYALDARAAGAGDQQAPDFVGSALQFVQDYSDAFNQNMAAVASAPFDFVVGVLGDYAAGPQASAAVNDSIPSPALVTSAGLTQDQLSSVQSLLSSYGVDNSRIKAVTAILSNTGPKRDDGQGMSQQMASSSPCAVPSRALMRGMRSEDVTVLQQRLSDQGLLAPGDVSGFFGSTTQAALKQFQAENNIVASGTPETTGFGMAGKKTIDAFRNCGVRGERHGEDRMMPPVQSGQGSSTQPTMPGRGDRDRGDHGRGGRDQGNQPMNGGTPVPQIMQGLDASQAGAAALFQFAQDYSDAFNQNLAAVASSPFNLAVGSLSDFFDALGIQ